MAGKLLGKPVVLNSGNPGVMSCRNWDALLNNANLSPDGRLIKILKAIVRRIFASADAVICVAREIEENGFCGYGQMQSHNEERYGCA